MKKSIDLNRDLNSDLNQSDLNQPTVEVLVDYIHLKLMQVDPVKDFLLLKLSVDIVWILTEVVAQQI